MIIILITVIIATATISSREGHYHYQLFRIGAFQFLFFVFCAFVGDVELECILPEDIVVPNAFLFHKLSMNMMNVKSFDLSETFHSIGTHQMAWR